MDAATTDKATLMIGKCRACGVIRRTMKPATVGGGGLYLYADSQPFDAKCDACGVRALSFRPVNGVRKPRVKCNAICENATHGTCNCECGGKNHGKSHAMI